MWSFVYTLEDYATEIGGCMMTVANLGLSFLDVRIDRLFERFKKNKCKVGDNVFAAGEAWKDQDGRIKTCLRGGRIALVSGLEKSTEAR